MWSSNQKKIEEMVGDGLVLDIGGWVDPFLRADYVIDLFPYETRGIATHGIGTLPRTCVYPEPLPGERFQKKTWIIHDICSEQPFPFPDNMFDFVVCSHVLEDLRDPLRVCSEIIRVGRAGYIETPSRIGECILWNGMVGAAHHRWTVESSGLGLEFRMKYHFLHTSSKYYIPASFARKIPLKARLLEFFWEDSFDYREIMGYEYYQEAADFIQQFNISKFYYALDILRNVKYASQRVFSNIFHNPPDPSLSEETWTWAKLFEVSEDWLQYR